MSMTRLLCASALLLLWIASSVSAQSGPVQNGLNAPLNLTFVTEADRVRVTTPGTALVWRLEVLNAKGEPVFDSGVVTATELDWPLVDVQGNAVESGLYRYTLTIGGGGSEARLQRGELQIERVRSLYRISSLTTESTGDITLTATEGPVPSASASDLGSPSTLPRSLGTATFGAPQPYISGSGTTNVMTKWLDGPGGVVGDTTVSEYAGAVTIGNGTYYGNLQIYGGPANDVFAGMGPNIVSGPAFNFGYAGASFGRSAGFFNVRPDASATPPNPSLRFMTANVERMIISNAGDVGIGISNPTSKLHVVTNGGFGMYGVYGESSTSVGVYGFSPVDKGVRGVSTSGIGVLGESNGSTGVYGSGPTIGVRGISGIGAGVWGESATGVGVYGLSPSNLSSGRGVYGYSSGGIGVLGQSSSGFAGEFQGKVAVLGSVGIGTETPDRTLDVAGLFRVKNGAFGIEMNGTGGFFPVLDAVQPLGDGTHRWQAVFATLGTIQTSDARLKQRVTNLENGLAAVMRLRPVSFEWKDTADGRRHLGLLAQEVEPVLPGVIEHDPNPDVPLGLNYSELIPVVIKAIQEQQATITRLANENAVLAARLAALEHVLQEIKKQPE